MASAGCWSLPGLPDRRRDGLDPEWGVRPLVVQLGSVDDLAGGRGLPGLRDTPQPSLSSFEIILAEALEAYHQLGDVGPVLLVHGSGAICLVVLDRIGTTGKTCVVTLTFEDPTGWRVSGSEER